MVYEIRFPFKYCNNIVTTDQHLTWIVGNIDDVTSSLPIDYRWCSVAANKIEVEILDPVNPYADLTQQTNLPEKFEIESSIYFGYRKASNISSSN
jgi:hypothetical protein